MADMTEQQLEQWIKSWEGLKLKMYKDTMDKTTVGWGRDIQDCGIRLDEAELMFQNDLKQAREELQQLPWFNELPHNVQSALINMNFNLGITKFLEFHAMINALKVKNYTLAAQAALDSLWAKEVHGRATDIATMIREGK